MSEWFCPAPWCDVVESGPRDLAEHVNGEHAGEWRDAGWPDEEVRHV